jgi:hypothetical protein
MGTSRSRVGLSAPSNSDHISFSSMAKNHEGQEITERTKRGEIEETYHVLTHGRGGEPN